MLKILILCTGNSCRSQMAEAFLKSFDANLQVFSAGTKPSEAVNPLAVKVMKEKGLDISGNKPKNVLEFISQSFDYVITVCDEANKTCPVFTGITRNRLHFSFNDPAAFQGNYEDVLNFFRKIRDEIFVKFYEFYNNTLKKY